MTASPQQWDAQTLGHRVEALLDEAQALIDRLGLISASQRDAVESGDVVRIVEVVAQREPLVRAIVRVGEEIGALVENPRLVAMLPDDQRTGALGRIGALEHTMKHLREQDAHDQQLMERARDRLAEQLSGMGTGKTALKAYSARPANPNPTMQDRRG